MKRLLNIQESATAYELVDRLREAGIEAKVVIERTPQVFFGGGTQDMSIWAPPETDDTIAQAIIDDVLAQVTSIICPTCGYDLRGHCGQTNCPECGRPVHAPEPPRICGQCGEESPASFDMCWNCGNDL